jgi:hypothetical protein
MATSGPPSDAAKRLQGLKLSNKAEWRKTLERAFQGGATMNEAAERLGGLARLTLLRHVKALESETGRRLDRAPNPAPNPAEGPVPGNGAHRAPRRPPAGGAEVRRGGRTAGAAARR